MSKPRSEETKRKIAEKARQRWADPAFQEKMRGINKQAAKKRNVSGENNPMHGRTHGEKARKAIAEAARKRHEVDPEHLQAISRQGIKAKLEKGISDETRQKLSVSSRKRWENPEYREKITEAGAGRTHDEATKEKLSRLMKARWSDPDNREALLAQALKSLDRARSVPLSDETRQKLSESTKAQWSDPDQRDQMRKAISKAKEGKCAGEANPRYGCMLSEETKRKISEKAKGREISPETRAKISAAMVGLKPFQGRQHTDEAKNVVAEKARTRWSNPEYRARNIAAVKARANEPEQRRKAAERTKKLWEDPRFRKKALEALASKKPTSLDVPVAQVLDALGIKYESQKIIGRCIVDFYIPDCNLIIEADGWYWHNKPEVKARDKRRDAWLRSKGYWVERICEQKIKADVDTTVIEALEPNGKPNQ
jgi:very-short-patch-repair endonuclease